VPAWVVCDGSDPQQSFLLSIFHNRKSGWVTRNIVRLLGHWSYKQAEEYAVKMKKEHLSLANFQDVRFAIYIAFTTFIQIDECNILCIPEEACNNI
jgi:hypothetical protein